MAESVPLESDSYSLTREEAAEKVRDDLTFLAAFLIPEETISEYPPFYYKVFAFILKSLMENNPGDVFRFALGLPRGHVKTTFLKILICYLIIHDYEYSFFLIVCANEPLAESFLSDINEIMKSDNVTDVYGSWEQSLIIDTKKKIRAKWRGRDIILAAIGAQTSVRGVNIANRRPQVIVCDDVQTLESAESATDNAKLLKWLTGTLFKARSKTAKTALFYLGNLYDTECILYKLSQSPNWTSLITGAILEGRKALWPELNSLEALLEEYAHDESIGQGHVWFAEVQNDPIGSSFGLVPHGATIPRPDLDVPLDAHPIKFITIDLAQDKDTSDDNVIGTHIMLDADETQDLAFGTINIDAGKYDPETVIKHTMEQVVEHKVNSVFIESNGYQGSLAFWMNKYLEALDLERSVHIYLLPSKINKTTRIKEWVKLLISGRWKLLSQDVHNKTIFQIYSFKVNKNNNVDDILDNFTLAQMAINKHEADIIANYNKYNSIFSDQDLGADELDGMGVHHTVYSLST